MAEGVESSAWDRRYASGQVYHGPAPRPFFAGKIHPGAWVLDLGCGAGKSLRTIAAAGPAWRLVGLDASLAALRLCRSGSAAPCARADARWLPLRSGSCAAVRIDFLLGHLDDADRRVAVSEVERVLAPGGFLEIHEFATGDLRDGEGRRLAPQTFEREGIATRYFSPGALGGLFAHCQGAEDILERKLRFSPRPRRILRWRATRSSECDAPSTHASDARDA